MEISKEDLQAMLQQAADEAIARVASQHPKIAGKIYGTSNIQVRLTGCTSAILKRMGIEPKHHNMSAALRQALDVGLTEIESQEYVPISKRPLLSTRVDNNTLARVKKSGASLSHLFILGLFIQGTKITEEKTIE